MKDGSSLISRMKKWAVYRERLPYRASTYRRIHHHHAEHRRLRLPDRLQRRTCSVGNSSYKAILKQSAKEFAKYNQLYPDQFSKLEKDMINGFGSAKEQWFSSLCCRWKRTAPGTACSSTRSAGRCTPPKARILSTCKHAGRRGRYPRCGIRTGVPQL